MKSIGAAFFRSDALPDVNHMRGMQYQMMYKYHHAMLPIALQDLYIKTKSFTIIGLDNIIYCMFQAAHTQTFFSTPAY